MPLPHETNPRISPPDLEKGEDPTELSLMLSGQPYLSYNKYIDRIRDTAARRVWEINQIVDMGDRMREMREFVFMGVNVWIVQGFFCEYGFNITIGDEVFIGANCTLLDICPITIGSRTMLGPNVQILTPSHPISPEERNGLKGREWAKPVKIGNDCWIGAGATICPGVTIGDGVTIGAATVVTRDVGSRCVVVGNPGRVIKRIREDGGVEDVG
ncbi:hypothetical protein I302_105609 [Kwoniella bestiolae CBS 10118]|uniref:Maltose/galactoside acetyltransferase domain-containing protein n=1 Tax=Kwoniella bestiolae CBS 10118 TaxID=1296100 RepID=A0A1B9G1P2_9TREE|nr:hypothetical protein I302_04728 [Kwoniella bestiolae CBS 10118]OCF24918.1 hypothetical protein I302_04728 [Kwoniella bestiolae CBS 10118]